jgi:hypothetical protein
VSGRPPGKKNTNWSVILERGVEIVDSYDTLVTLRQLFYRLVAAMLIPNLKSCTAPFRR